MLLSNMILTYLQAVIEIGSYFNENGATIPKIKVPLHLFPSGNVDRTSFLVSMASWYLAAIYPKDNE